MPAGGRVRFERQPRRLRIARAAAVRTKTGSGRILGITVPTGFGCRKRFEQPGNLRVRRTPVFLARGRLRHNCSGTIKMRGTRPAKPAEAVSCQQQRLPAGLSAWAAAPACEKISSVRKESLAEGLVTLGHGDDFVRHRTWAV